MTRASRAVERASSSVSVRFKNASALQDERQRLAGQALHLERRERVGARLALGEDCHRDVPARGVSDEAESAERGHGGPDDEHRRPRRRCRRRRAVRLRLDGVAENTTRGLSGPPPHARQRGDEITDAAIAIELDVAVRSAPRSTAFVRRLFSVRVSRDTRVRRLRECRIPRRVARAGTVVGGARRRRRRNHFVRRAVQLERVFAPGGVVQPIDVLRDEAPNLASFLRVRQRVVRRLGTVRSANSSHPANERAQ